MSNIFIITLQNLLTISLHAYRKKNEYQILYFPMEDPLSPDEQLARKEVYSTKTI